MDLDECAGAGVPVSVAVREVAGARGASYSDDTDRTYPCASIVKVSVLAALLLRAQDEGRGLTGQERARAAGMIERSDNDAATVLWNVIGGAEGLDTAHRRLGLRRTAAVRAWGLTRTTAADQLVLLEAVFGGGPDSVLSEGSRRFVADLMARVVAGQAWGVSAAGSGWALKNGWLPRGAAGLWVVHSVGRVTAGGRDWLVAVLSEGHRTKEAGVALVEAAARAAVSAAGGVR